MVYTCHVLFVPLLIDTLENPMSWLVQIELQLTWESKDLLDLWISFPLGIKPVTGLLSHTVGYF